MHLLKKLYNYVLNGDTKIPSRATLTVQSGATATVDSGGTVTVSSGGTANLNGTTNIKSAELSIPLTVLYNDVQTTIGAFFADRIMEVSSIRVRPSTAATTACTLIAYKVPSGTTGFASGSQMNATALNMSASTAAILKNLTLTAGSALQLATGDAIGFTFSAAPEGARGSITVNLKPV